MFKLIGALLTLYTVYAATTGRVLVKSGPWGRIVLKQESPEYFWLAIVIYAGLSIALIFWF
jgi:choline-glycine betaine transporter